MDNENKSIEIPFGAKDSELDEWEYTIPEGYEAEIKDGKMIVRKVESEDERIRKELISLVTWSTSYSASGVTKEDADNLIAWLEKQGEQKPTDKVEPKFKEGDGVFVEQIDNVVNGPFRITKIENNTYVFDGLRLTVLPFSSEHCMRLWTIQDAKDGDVLAMNLSKQNNWIGIFKETDGCTFKTYCFLNRNEDLVINPKCCKGHGTYKVFPATKEQHEILFAKMKKAGYEWDAEKKELKKIEQNSALSEEDETHRHWILEMLKAGEIKTPEFADHFKAASNWLKSIRPQKRWKPTEEQMKALDFAIDCTVCQEFRDKRMVLKELLKQLKAL